MSDEPVADTRTVENRAMSALKDALLADDILKDYPDVDVADAYLDDGFFRVLVERKNEISPGVPLFKARASVTIATHIEEDADRALIDSLFDRIQTILLQQAVISDTVTEVKAVQIENVSDYEIADERFQTLTITLNIFIQP